MPGMTSETWFVPTEGGRLRDRLRRALRPRPLPHAGPGHGGARRPTSRDRIKEDGRGVAAPSRYQERAARWPTPQTAHAGKLTPTRTPRRFIWKYVFSKDHKVIGIQYYVTAMLMALVAGILAMLIRLQLAWPEKTWPWHRDASCPRASATAS